MEKYHIDITELAEKDLFEIGMYISKELLEPEIAKKTVSKIADAIFTLEEMPLRNTVVSDERLASKDIRKIIVENYMIFYIVNYKSKKVTIVRILYAKRNWIDIL